MRARLFSFLIFLFFSKLSAQNLVPDPGFENYVTCPVSQGVSPVPLFPFTSSWFQATQGSDDYYNTCAPPTTYASVPSNLGGFQYPLNGNGYAGILCWAEQSVDYREYIETQLSQTLTAGQTYDVGFLVSLGDVSKRSVIELGAYLSQSIVSVNNNFQLPFVPQVENSNGFLDDSVNWQEVKGSYTATGGEQYITIGLFKNDGLATFQGPSTFQITDEMYYYIDSVFVIPCTPFNPGHDSSFSICATNAPIDLMNYIGVADTGGKWYSPAGTLFTNPLDPASAVSGNYKYIGGNGTCSDTATVSVTIDAMVNSGLDDTVNICSSTDLFLLLKGNPDAGGTWLDPDGSAFTNPFDPQANAPGLYSYTVTNGACSDEATLLVDTNNDLAIVITGSANSTCSPLSVNFLVEDSYNDITSVSWDFDDGNTSTDNPAIEIFTDTGCYQIHVQVTTSGGCSAVNPGQFEICVDPSPIADFTFTPSEPSLANPLTTFQNESTHADNYSWQFGNFASSTEENPVIDFSNAPDTSAVCLIATNQFGCADTICKTIPFLLTPGSLYVPNAFTPNGDGLNDQFEVIVLYQQSYELKIFDRWGQLVFKSNDPSQSWNGNIKGKPAEIGTYAYSIRVQFLDSKEISRTGNVTLFR